jgi:hypothetical protein
MNIAEKVIDNERVSIEHIVVQPGPSKAAL